MNREWSVYTDSPTSRGGRSMRVSLSAKGLIAINNLAFQSLAEPEAVELMFDKANKVIGIRKCDPKLKNAFAVKKQARSNSYYVRAMAFCRFYNIVVKQTVAFTDLELEGDVLTLAFAKSSDVSRKEQEAKPQEELFVLGGSN